MGVESASPQRTGQGRVQAMGRQTGQAPTHGLLGKGEGGNAGPDGALRVLQWLNVAEAALNGRLAECRGEWVGEWVA